MARRIGFFPILIASFATTVAFINPLRAYGETVTSQPAAAARTGEQPALSPAQAQATVERVASLIEQRYVSPEVGRRYAASLRANIRAGRYAALSDAAALGRLVTADLQAVAPDGHVSVRPPREPGARTVATAAQPVPAGLATGIIDARWIKPGVAYIAFDHFSDEPAAVAALNDFLHTYGGARALIIDARRDRGGSFPMLGILGDHLFGERRILANMDVSAKTVEENGVPFPEGPELRRTAAPAGLVRFQHWSVPAADARLFGVPVYYLTSRRTFSAAEHLAMVLKSTGRATLIGEATGGGNHFGGTEEVGAGLEMFVPIGRTTDPTTSKDWETTGVAPDVAVPADAALDEALKRIG